MRRSLGDLAALLASCGKAGREPVTLTYLVDRAKERMRIAGRGQKAGNGGASSSPVTFNLPCMPVRVLINLAYIISNFQSGAVGLKLRATRRAKLSPMRTLRVYAGKRFVIHAVQADWSRATTAAAVSP
jgi:hypothetical protein